MVWLFKKKRVSRKDQKLKDLKRQALNKLSSIKRKKITKETTEGLFFVIRTFFAYYFGVRRANTFSAVSNSIKCRKFEHKEEVMAYLDKAQFLEYGIEKISKKDIDNLIKEFKALVEVL